LHTPADSTSANTALERHPEIATHLSALSAKLDNAAIARLNAKVDLQKMTVEEAASMFLKESGLL